MKVDCFLLADAADDTGGKLYIIGGGWDSLRVDSLPIIHPHMALAIRICVPWGDTNQKSKIRIDLVHEDGSSTFDSPLESELTVGRPPTVKPGNDIIVPLVINLHNIELHMEGTYTFRMSIDAEDKASVKFHVIQNS